MALSFLVPPSLGKAKAGARAELLEQALGSELDEEVAIIVPEDYGDLQARALSGEVDLLWCPAAVCARIEWQSRAIYKTVRRGSSTYRSVLIARRSASLSLETLWGLRAVWVDPLSVGGYLLAFDMLKQRGIEPDRTFRSQAFLGSHPAVTSAIVHGSADVGAVSTTRETQTSIREALTMFIGPPESQLVGIAVTDEAPNDGIVLTARLSHAKAKAIAEKLFPKAGPVGKAPSLLLSVMECDRFVQAAPKEYEPLLRLAMRARPTFFPPSR